MAIGTEQRVFSQLFTVMVGAVMDEAHRAHEKHKARSFLYPDAFTDEERLGYLVEEVGEVAKALSYDCGSPANLREELVQVAHLAALWVAVLDVKHGDEILRDIQELYASR